MSTTTTLARSANMATAPQPPRNPGPRPYRDFLTPSLHRRFTKAALVSLSTSYATAVIMSRPSLLWFWFPLSIQGIRAGMIFMSVLTVFVLRVANLRVGSLQTPSSAYAFLRGCFTWRPYRTLAWYVVSAFIFGEVYMWSTTEDKRLKLVDPGKPYERPFLNERAIYLRSLFMMLGVWQTGYHLWYDLDRVEVSSSQQETKSALDDTSPSDALAELVAKANPIVQHALRTIIYMTPIAPFIYTLVLRRTVWSWTFAIQDIIAGLPKHQKLTRLPPLFGDLAVVFWIWGLILVMLWSTANDAFKSYIALAPLNKKGQPLSSDSKDPNGTLLAGLKAKKEYVRSSAFAEFALIAKGDPARREGIFKELDRGGSSTWSQVMTVSLAQLHGISKRINDFRNPPKPNPPMPEQLPGDVHHLPRMAPQIKQDNIFTSSPPPKQGLVSDFGKFAKSHGNQPGSQNPFSPRARRLLSSSANALLSEERQQALSQSGLGRLLRENSVKFLSLPYIGPFFSFTYARRASAVVIGEAQREGSNESVIVNAAIGLATLAARSSQEDHSGRASRDIATIVRTYVASITTIEEFIAWLQPHWTDVDFKNKKVADVDNVIGQLRAGLRMILEAFEGYNELGLTIKEKRISREKAGMTESDGDVFLESRASGTGNGQAPEVRERRRPV